MQLAKFRDPLAEVEPHPISEITYMETGDPVLWVRRIGHHEYISAMLSAARSNPGTEKLLRERADEKKADGDPPVAAAGQEKPLKASDITNADLERILVFLDHLRRPAVSLIDRVVGLPTCVLDDDGNEVVGDDGLVVVRYVDTRELSREVADELIFELLADPIILGAVVKWARDKQDSYLAHLEDVRKNFVPSSRPGAGKGTSKSAN